MTPPSLPTPSSPGSMCPSSRAAGIPTRRLRIEVTGAVQGVGFRPTVHRLATGADLTGWVVNDTDGVRIEVEGSEDGLEGFLRALRDNPPPRSVIHGLRHEWLDPAGFQDFTIRASDGSGPLRAAVLPDLATCPACLAEIFDPHHRRFGYAFTNCTDCGPRLSIIRDLPYDRPSTTMAGFDMCPRCVAEYADPADRRFHAQPNACPECGPRLAWHRGGGEREGRLTISGGSGDRAVVSAAVRALGDGLVVAVRGLGGFHLMCDARSEEAVAALRARKARPTKPLAVMVRDLEMAAAVVELSEAETALLVGPEAPIVLARARRDTGVAPSVAPGNPYLGVMLPYTPLHHLLLAATGGPLVATSGNLGEEPICTGRKEALHRLRGIADRFLMHDRPIERPVEDSVAAVLDGAPTLVRRSRGYAPLPLALDFKAPPTLAVGGHQKNAVALARGREAWLGPHVGDLGAPESRKAFRRCIEDMLRLYRVRPEVVAHDLHPDYASTLWAVEERGVAPSRRVAVQHHHAHLASVLAEHGRSVGPPVLGWIWDGTGYGTDGTTWGGELLAGDATSFERVAHLRPFRLPGGEEAVRHPPRIALALLVEAGMETRLAGLDSTTERVLVRMVERGVSAPVTTSAGRLFDAVAALLGLVDRTTFEGEAAMALEHATDGDEDGAYTLEVRRETLSGPWLLDWRPMLEELAADLRAGTRAEVVAARFQNGLVQGAVEVADLVGLDTVALSGGCFQNRILVERGAEALRSRGFEVLQNRRVPPNDGGLALGQVAVAAARPESARNT